MGYNPPPPPAAMVWGGGTLPLPWVVYEDDHVAVVDTPVFLITVGAKMEDLRSVLPFILCLPALAVSCHCCQRSSGNPMGMSIPRHMHRLDRCTRKIVVVAKIDRAKMALRQYFLDRYVRRLYVALVFYPDGNSNVNLAPSLPSEKVDTGNKGGEEGGGGGGTSSTTAPTENWRQRGGAPSPAPAFFRRPAGTKTVTKTTTKPHPFCLCLRLPLGNEPLHGKVPLDSTAPIVLPW